MSCPLDTKVEENNPSPQRWISGTNIDRSCKADNTSSDRVGYVTAITGRLKEAKTSSIQLFQPGSCTKDPNFIQAEYSFIYLLTEANALYELKHVGCEPRIFIKPYECLSEVVKTVDQKLIIIVSQSLSRHFVPLIHDLIQVIYIYILYKYDSYHEDEDDSYANDKRYRKVRGSSIGATMLISKLNDDLNQLSNIPLREPDFTDLERLNTNIDFYVVSKQPSSLKSLTDEEQNFVSFQLIIKAILESDSANPLNNLNTLTGLCKLYPKQNEEKFTSETNYEFLQNCVSKNAINLYLSNTSLKNELNACFCSKNIQKICRLWVFIHGLLKQLPGGKKAIMVYRGQYLRDSQLQKLKNNVGNFMTFTKFFSMSTSNIRAIRRSGGSHFHTTLKSVVFQLEISSDNTSTRFSMIQQSYEELIFLFAVGSVFCIESVEKLNDQIWCCKLRINSDDESKVARMFQHFEMDIGTSLTYLSLGVYLNEIGNKDIAVKYYETLWAIATDDDTISSINNNLAIIRERQNNMISARKFSDEASKTGKVDTLKASTSLSELKKDVVMADILPDTSPIINYYNLACIYHQAKRFNEALEECEKALGLSTTVPDSVNIALVHSAKGSVCFSQKNYEAALVSFQMALDIALIHLPSTDPLIDQYLNNVRLLKNIIKEK